MEETPSVQFANNVVNTEYEDLGERYVARAKERLADAVGVMSAGSRGVGVEKAVEMVRELGGHADASVYNYGGAVPVEYAAFLNSLQIRSFDSEAVDAEGLLARWPAHITSTTIPTALALAEKYKLSGKQFLSALAVGEDMAARLTEASRFDPLGCFDGNGTNNTMGATAIAAKAMGLNAEETHDAFGIALHLCGGTMKSTSGSWAFKLGNSFAAKSGIECARLAKTGFHGLVEPLTDKKCFFDMFAPAADPTDLTKDLGKIYYCDAVIKPWACCRGNHVVLDAVRPIIEEHGTFKAADIKHVTFGGTKSLTNGDFPFGTTCEVDGLFNRRFTLSTYLLTGQVVAASYDPAWMTSPELGELLGKLEFSEWNPLAGAKGAGGMAAFVEIELESGETLRSEVKGVILGDVDKKPMTKEQFEAKWNANAAFGGKVSVEKLQEAKDMAWNVENVSDMSEFTKLLVP